MSASATQAATKRKRVIGRSERQRKTTIGLLCVAFLYTNRILNFKKCRTTRLYLCDSFVSDTFNNNLSSIFGQPLVKRFALCYRTVVLSVLSVTLVWPIVTKRWVDQDETWHGGRPNPSHIVLDGDPAPPKGALPNFRPTSIVAKRLDGSRCHLVGRAPTLATLY